MKYNYKKIVFIESLLFIVGWTIIFLLGADFPPPEGFWKIIMLVVILDLIQIPYLYDLLTHINMKPTFFKNFLFFICGGVIVSLLTSRKNVGGDLKQRMIWILMVTFVSIVYGNVLWFVNRLFVKSIKK